MTLNRHPPDLVKILCPHVYKLGYDTCATLEESNNNESRQKQAAIKNIVNLF